jgi:hypothetical protein
LKDEERQLADFFPLEWPPYAAAVPPFIPRRLAWPHFETWSLSQWLHNEEYQAVLGSVLGLIAIKAWHIWAS